jgi:hypothetical protein
MSEQQMFRIPLPLNFRNLAPRDFYLFHTLKDKFQRIHLVDGEDLCEQLLKTQPAISVDELKHVFTA